MLFANISPRYVINFTIGAPAITILFPSEGSSISYNDVRTAVDIMNVVCDNKTVTPSIERINGYPDTTTVKHEIDERIVYRCSSLMLYCFDSLDRVTNDFFKIKNYVIPEGVLKIEITYRLRFPGGKVSQPMQVVFIGSDASISIMNLK